MALARYESVATNTSGDVIPNATVEVRRDQPGRPIVPLWADREGTAPLGNPITADSEGKFGFHVTGGVYYVRVFTGPSQQPLQEYVRRYLAVGTAAERDVEDLASALEAGTASFPTLADLQLFVPAEVEGIGGKVTTSEDAGFYHYDDSRDPGDKWVFDRPLFDTLARMNVTGGDANDIEAEVATGVADSAVVMLWIEAPADNTAPVRINDIPVLTIDEEELLPGQWLAGRTYWFSDEGAFYKLRTESDVSGLVAQAEAAATAAQDAQEASQTAQAGAETARDEAQGYAAGLNIAPIAPGDAGKLLQVNEEEDGSDWIDPPSPPDASVTEDKLAVSLKNRITGVAADRAVLAAMSGADFLSVDLIEAGRNGRFYPTGDDISARVTADPQQGLVVAFASDLTGASGGWIRDFTGAPNVTWWGAKFDGATNDTSAIHAAFVAWPSGRIEAPAGTSRCNIIVPRNIRFVGQGRFKSILKAASSSSAIVELGDTSGTNTWFIGLEGFQIDGEGTAVKGLRVGNSGAGRTVVYGQINDIYVHDCVDNIHVQSVLAGLRCDNVYSYTATNDGLYIAASDVVTTVEFSHCQFRQCKVGVDILSGVLIGFNTCVIESNKNTGLMYNRASLGGVRQVKFRDTWFENNGHTYTTLATAGAMYVDMTAGLVSLGYSSTLQFENCLFSSPTVGGVDLPEVTIQRGDNIEFRNCQFTAFNSDRLKFSTGTGYCFATLINCGVAESNANPTLYASFPAQVTSGGKQLGFSYEYMFNGKRYSSVVAGP